MNLSGKNGNIPVSAEKKWHIVYTKPQNEKKVADYFLQKNIEYYLPLISKKRNWSDRVKIIDFPLFPGYIFVKIDYSFERLEVLKCPGVLSFLMYRGKPGILSEGEINSLISLVEYSKEIRSDPVEYFPKGQEVEILFGPLKGVRGVVNFVKNKQRIFVKIEMLGRMVSAEVDVMDVEKVMH